MQDFTKPFKLKNEVKQLELNIPNQPKKGFIASRMNKDNFWNLMYWLGMFLGFGSASFIAQPISGIICWIAIIGMPYLVKRNTDITFDKMEQGVPMFIVNGNKRVNATGIGFVGLLVVSFFIAVLITRVDSIPVFFLVLWFTPALYCILRNIPIAVYFKKEAWVGDSKAPHGSSSSGSYYSSNQYFFDRNRSDIVHDHTYRHLSFNIYNRR